MRNVRFQSDVAVARVGLTEGKKCVQCLYQTIAIVACMTVERFLLHSSLQVSGRVNRIRTLQCTEQSNANVSRGFTLDDDNL
jgi:hypothetical protein